MKGSDLMPYGSHKGTKMTNVPAQYLLWLYENNKCSGEVKAYIIDNLDILIAYRYGMRGNKSS
jgi:uncharacterized protein (DUF3820 family)